MVQAKWIAIALLGLGSMGWAEEKQAGQPVLGVKKRSDSVCSLVGTMRRAGGSSGNEGNMSSMGGLVRRNFDADSIATCKRTTKDYCLSKMAEHYFPVSLEMTFRAHASSETTVRMVFSERCVPEMTR